MTTAPRGIDHVALNVPDVPAALAFYTDVLGLTQRDDRPDFGIAGAWLNAGEQQVHLIELPPPNNMGQHFALLYENIGAVVEKLRAQGFTVSDPAASSPGRHQAFLNDPWGNAIELHQHDSSPAGEPAP
ncbi:MAG TPA: VOC family protein [Acidimicrobiales bacterium]|nr:VOC family protein [Acidimicrobiales bacterium]